MSLGSGLKNYNRRDVVRVRALRTPTRARQSRREEEFVSDTDRGSCSKRFPERFLPTHCGPEHT